jgi:hypothetical protein
LRWVLESLLFITNKFRDLSLQEPELPDVTGLGTGRLALVPVRVGLINEARLRHRSMVLGEADTDPPRDKTNHNLAGFPDTTYPIYQAPPEFDSEGSREVYMVGQGEQPTKKTAKEIA